jgi:hypothetical protein
MADAHLQQAPLMVLPRTRAARVRQVPRTVVPRAALREKRAKELLNFSRVLESPAYGLREAAAYVRGLVTASCVGIDDLPRLPWLESHATPFGLANPRGGGSRGLAECAVEPQGAVQAAADLTEAYKVW